MLTTRSRTILEAARRQGSLATRNVSRMSQKLLGRRPWHMLLLVAIWSAFVGLAGVVLGVIVQQKNLPESYAGRVDYMMRQMRIGQKDVSSVEWSLVNSNRHMLQVAKIRVSDVLINGGSLAEVGDHILLATPQGQLSYLDPQNRLRPIDLRVRMNLETLRNTSLYREPLFNSANVRTHDLLAMQTGPNAYDLYASFNRFAGDCFDYVVARVSLRVDAQGVTPAGGWQDVWTAKPCIPLKDRGSIFEGVAAGGRMLKLDDHTILVSVGDFQFDGFYESRQLSADPKTDLGKIVAVDIVTGASRHYATGLRNPEGLAFDAKGRLWETEHGPQGGDELNLIREGANYGWPFVTYGMVYGSPPTEWPFNTKPGTHDGFERPRYAFVPSIGISNIIAPDAREFPNWDGDLLVGSLRQQSLYVIRMEADDVVYAEPIDMGARLRDFASLKDGRLAVLTDGGYLLIIRNAETHADAPPFTVTGLKSLATPSIEEAPQLETMTTYDRGRALFLSACASCHSLGGEVGAGPPLNGIVGRSVASVEGFGYSDALGKRGGVWTDGLLTAFLDHPEAVAPGTTMPFPGLFDRDTPAVVEFLKSQ